MKEAKNVGLGFLDALALLFIALKLTGCISWSWVWTLCPIWVGFVLLTIVIFSSAPGEKVSQPTGSSLTNFQRDAAER